LLRRFWFVLPPGTPGAFGCGVTAFSVEDSRFLIGRDMLRGGPVPQELELIEDVDVSTLDPGHVIPNMEEPVSRGIRFPRGFTRVG